MEPMTHNAVVKGLLDIIERLSKQRRLVTNYTRSHQHQLDQLDSEIKAALWAIRLIEKGTEAK